MPSPEPLDQDAFDAIRHESAVDLNFDNRWIVRSLVLTVEAARARLNPAGA